MMMGRWWIGERSTFVPTRRASVLECWYNKADVSFWSMNMVTFRVSTEVPEDRRVVVVLPPEIPPGKAELIVTVESQNGAQAKRPGTSLADWAEANAEHWGDRLSSEDVEGFTGRRY